MGRGDPLCRAAADLTLLCKLWALAVRNQCARIHRNRLRWCGRHRPGFPGSDPEVLLWRCLGDPRPDHGHGVHHRYPDATLAALAHRVRKAMIRAKAPAAIDHAALRERYPQLMRGDYGARLIAAVAV